jgi:predicted RNA-binding protein with RPS1 domain
MLVKGEVTQIVAFRCDPLAIDSELQGLLHVSEITEKRGAAVKDLVNIGDILDVKIINIDKDKKKISLSVLALERDKEETEVRNYLAQAGESENTATIGDALEEDK